MGLSLNRFSLAEHRRTVYCAVCCQRVDEVIDLGVVLSTREWVIEYRCHGKTEIVRLSTQSLESDDRLFSAFVDEYREKVRIEAEDSALAACGILDPEIIRLNEEDAALSACGA